MVEELTINWRRAEGGFADFCMGYFDENSIALCQVGFEGESNKNSDGVNSNILLFFERIVVTIFRYIFVKKYAITEASENLQQKLNKLNSIFDALISSAMHTFCVVVSVINYNKLIQKVGFT